MNPMKRLGLVALVVVGVALLASAPAQAGKVADPWGPHELANVGDEPRASGTATLTDVVCTGWGSGYPGPWYYEAYTAVLTVQCRKLTPGATYWTCVGTFIADRTGKGSATGQVSWFYRTDPWWGNSGGLVVDVVRADDTVVLHTDW
jgi:hypothetical protein